MLRTMNNWLLSFTDLDYPSIREWLATHAEPAAPLDVDIYSSTYTKSDFVPYDKRTYQSQGYQQDESIKVRATQARSSFISFACVYYCSYQSRGSNSNAAK